MNPSLQTLEPREYGTGIATLIVINRDLVEIHNRTGIVFDPKSVAEVRMKRREVMCDRPYATLTLIPEEVDFNPESMPQDQGHADRTESRLLASAVVCRSRMIGMRTKSYFSYCPRSHRILVTDDERTARMWLEERSAGIAGTGS